MECPRCKQTSNQIKAGKNNSGSQRWRCKNCERHYTPEPYPNGYSKDKKIFALRLYLEGNTLRGIGRLLGIHHQTVANWLEEVADHLPPAPLPKEVRIGELDELYTSIQGKKTAITS
jgi:transposase-like protein